MFKIRDRVTCIRDYQRDTPLRNSLVSLSGTVVDKMGASIGIEFDEIISDGHNCNGNGASRHCWYIPEEFLIHEECASDEIESESIDFDQFCQVLNLER